MISDYRSEKNAIDYLKIGLPSLLAKPKVLVIDDSPFILDACSQALCLDAESYHISTFERLENHVAAEPNFFARFVCVIKEFNLDGSRLDAIEIAMFIKTQCAQIPIFLSSDCSHLIANTDGAIDQIIGKDPIYRADQIELSGQGWPPGADSFDHMHKIKQSTVM